MSDKKSVSIILMDSVVLIAFILLIIRSEETADILDISPMCISKTNPPVIIDPSISNKMFILSQYLFLNKKMHNCTLTVLF